MIIINKKIMIISALLLVFAVLLLLCVYRSGNFGNTIDKKLHNIMYPKDSSVMTSSRAEDYIKASATDYRYIIVHGEKSLDYLLYKFSLDDSNGLEQYIMAIACSEILKDTSHVQNWITGRDWYDQYIASDEYVARKLFVDYLDRYKRSLNITTRISDYSVSRIDIKTKNETDFQFGVTYSVKPFVIIEGYSNWEAGNGHLANDGWIKNKYYEITVTKTGGKYKITQMATGG